MALALLALMDAKPVAWQWFYYKQWHVTNDEERARDVAWMGNVKVHPLYTGAMLQHQPQNEKQNIPEIIPGWIPVGARMPERGVDVLACKVSPIGGYEEIETAQWHGGMKGNQPVFIIGADTIEPAFWMPLPAAPQEVKGE
ncbi:TPA: DUF551 domain-containing protein [Klebsiella michiganensis]|nr:DUF551 domain-containing protein [Klebsiella michiganensis]